MNSQTQEVLAVLRERGEDGITPMEALAWIGTMRLAARIADAKHLLEPDEEIVTLRQATLNGATVARYVIRKRRPQPVVQEGLWS